MFLKPSLWYKCLYKCVKCCDINPHQSRYTKTELTQCSNRFSKMASKFVQRTVAWVHTEHLILKAWALIFYSYSEHA